MKRFIKAITALMLMFAVVCAACTKDEEENGNGSGNGLEEPQYFDVNVSATPTSGGTVSGGGSFEKGQSCTIIATPATDYVFDNWTENDSLVSTNSSYTFAVTGNRDLVANFTYNGGGEQPKYFTIIVSAYPFEGGSTWGGGRFREGQSCTVEAIPDNVYTFINWTDEYGNLVSTDVCYTFTVERNRSLVANFSHNIIGDYEYVDLGLPSGLLWATCNIGSNSPEGFGDYFAWGETEKKNSYDVTNYKFAAAGSDELHPQLTKYCNIPSYGYNGFTDNLTTLLPEDDAATANWGNGWRMPTKTEWEELFNNTTLTWTPQNNVDGILLTASNGVSLFLPAAGLRSGNILWYVGSYYGYYSSSLYKGEGNELWGDGPDCAMSIVGGSSGCNMSFGFRYPGRSVRAVCSAQ